MDIKKLKYTDDEIVLMDYYKSKGWTDSMLKLAGNKIAFMETGTTVITRDFKGLL